MSSNKFPFTAFLAGLSVGVGAATVVWSPIQAATFRYSFGDNGFERDWNNISRDMKIAFDKVQSTKRDND